MLGRLLRRVTNRGRSARPATRRGLIFGPCTWRVPPTRGPIAELVAYREAFDFCADLVAKRRGWRPNYSEPNLALGSASSFEVNIMSELLHQLAQFAVLRSQGIAFDWVGAVSLGELAAAHAAGVYELDEAVVAGLAVTEGVLTATGGDLVVIDTAHLNRLTGLSEAPVPVIAGFRHQVVGLRTADVARVCEMLPTMALGFDVLPHTSGVDGQLIERRLEGIAGRFPRVPFYTSSAGGRVTQTVGGAYWRRMACDVAQLGDLLQELHSCGPHDVVSLGTLTLESELVAGGVVTPGHRIDVADLARSNATALPLGAIDVNDSDFRHDPYPTYARLRSRCPVQHVRGGAALVVGYEAVQDVMRQPDRFSSTPNEKFPILHGADPPDHSRLRRLLTPFFSPASQLAREASIQRRTTEAIESIRGRSGFDLVAHFAEPAPRLVTCDWLGISADHVPAILAAPPTRISWKLVQAGLIDGGLLSELARVGEFAETEVAQLAPFLLMAGFTTVTDFLVNAICALLERPALLTRVRGERGIMPALVDELMRLDPPVHSMLRRATVDTELLGVTIAAGSTVYCGLAAANHDPSRFEVPAEVRLDRPPARHLGFGHGPHYCLGAVAGKLEAEIMLGALLCDLPPFTSEGPLHEHLARARPEFMIRRRVAELPLRFEQAAC